MTFYNPSIDLFQSGAIMKKIRSKMKGLEWPKDNMLFVSRSRAENSEVSGEIWQKFKLIQVLCMYLLPARMKKIR